MTADHLTPYAKQLIANADSTGRFPGGMNFCLCNHSAFAHRLPADAEGKHAAPCERCECTVFEDDPLRDAGPCVHCDEPTERYVADLDEWLCSNFCQVKWGARPSGVCVESDE